MSAQNHAADAGFDGSVIARLAVAAVSFSMYLRTREPVPDEVRGRFERALTAVEAHLAAADDDLYTDYPGNMLLVHAARVVHLLPRERELSVELGRALDGAAGLVLKRARSIHAPDEFQEVLGLR